MNPIIENYIKQVEKNKSNRIVPVLNPNEIHAAWIKTSELKCDNYVFDEVANEIMKYCYAPQFITKGAIMCGHRGVGKTLNLDIFASMNTNLFRIQTQCFEEREIELNYKIRGAEFLDKLSTLPCLVINDVGLQGNLNDYGTERNLIADILMLRYRLFQKNGSKTYITTNLMNEDKFNEYFGTKLSDRFKEMFNRVELRGESKR